MTSRSIVWILLSIKVRVRSLAAWVGVVSIGLEPVGPIGGG